MDQYLGFRFDSPAAVARHGNPALFPCDVDDPFASF